MVWAESRKYPQIELLITHPIEVCAVPSTKRIILFDQPRTLADSVGDHFARPWESKRLSLLYAAQDGGLW